MTLTARSNPYQGTTAWHMARRGKLTSSRMRTIVHGTPRGWETLIRKLRAELASPDVIEPDLDHVPAIAWGRKHEPVALAEAELQLGTDFELLGFAMHPHRDYIGCSSDALGWNRTVNIEVKSPLLLQRHHVVYQTRQVPQEYRAQIACQMYVHNCDRTLFVSYHPHAAHWRYRCVIVEVPRDPAYEALMLERCDQFMAIFHGEEGPMQKAVGVPGFF